MNTYRTDPPEMDDGPACRYCRVQPEGQCDCRCEGCYAVLVEGETCRCLENFPEALPSVVYLAGPMTGYQEWNFPAFDAAAVALRARGLTVLSPAEHDRETGFDPTSNHVDPAFLQNAMRWDIEAILRVEAVALLPGWQRSKGTAVEVAVAGAIGLPLYEVRDGTLCELTPTASTKEGPTLATPARKENR